MRASLIEMLLCMVVVGCLVWVMLSTTYDKGRRDGMCAYRWHTLGSTRPDTLELLAAGCHRPTTSSGDT